MAKVSFTNLKLKTNTSTQTFKYGSQDIEVLQYLPTEDKYDLIMITLQSAVDGDGIYNPILIDRYFNLNLVFMYSNITFTDKQREDLSKLYDILESNGIIEGVINLIPETEYNQLLDYMTEIMERRLELNKSIGGLISKVINDLPRQAAAMGDILDNFDQDKFQEVINFAKAANGGREIE